MSKPTKAAIKRRLNDLFVGATGSEVDVESCDLVAQAGADGLYRFMRAIRASFPNLRKDTTEVPIALRHWNLDEFTTLDNLAEFILSQMEEESDA